MQMMVNFYKSTPIKEIQSEVTKVGSCISDVKEWNNINKLQLNGPKTEYMIIGKASILQSSDNECFNKPPLILNDCEILPSNEAKNLGVIFDEQIKWHGVSDDLQCYCRSTFPEVSKGV